jgi:hypothetical protein
MSNSLQKVVDGVGVDNLIIVIMEALQKAKGLSPEFVAQKLLCFGADKVSIFQGTKARVIEHININYAPFAIGVHCMVHRCNLAFKTLSSLGIMSSIEICYKLVIPTLPITQIGTWSSLCLLK